jgi:hypothetical protein
MPSPRGPEPSAAASAFQTARPEALTSSWLSCSSPVASVRTSSASAPQMSPSPTRTLPGASAPSRSPYASTSRTSARASRPGA